MPRSARIHRRVFVAVHAPRSVAETARQPAIELDLPGLTIASAEDVYLTLMYMGDVDIRQIDERLESVERAAAGFGPFDLTLRSLETFPRNAPARLLAAVTDAPSPLVEIQRRLVARLARGKKSKGPFVPRFAVGRFSTPTAIAVHEPLRESASFPVREIAVLQSFVKSTGTEHAQLAAFGL